MAEQISHKRSDSRADAQRRQALERRNKLREYWQTTKSTKNIDAESHALDAQNESASVVPKDEEGVATIPKGGDLFQTDQKEGDATSDKAPADLTFLELVRIHNTLLKREAETSSSIKNTIYDNYCDLIKVQDVLGDIEHAEDINWARLRSAVEALRTEP